MSTVDAATYFAEKTVSSLHLRLSSKRRPSSMIRSRRNRCLQSLKAVSRGAQSLAFRARRAMAS
jgi:hypothetical protein